MKKEEFIERYGEEAYAKHRENSAALRTKYRAEHPEEEKASSQEQSRKGGKYYEKYLTHKHTGLRGKRNRTRMAHGNKWRPYKHIIAPESQLHHQWCPNSAKYDSLALVEKAQHMLGFIDVIEILEGEITLFTEKEIREQGESGSAF